MLGENDQSFRGVRIHGVNPVGIYNGLIASGKGSVSGEEKYTRYVQIVGTKLGRSQRPVMVRG